MRARNLSAADMADGEDAVQADKKPSIRDDFNNRSRKLAQELDNRFKDDSAIDIQQRQQQLNMLENLGFRTADDGTLVVTTAHNTEENGGIHVKQGAVCLPGIKDIPPEDPRYYERVLEGAVIAKAAFGDKPLCINSRQGEMQNMVHAYASELAGIKILNPPEKSLAEVNPELAQKMKDHWEKMETDAAQMRPDAAPEIPAEEVRNRYGEVRQNAAMAMAPS